MLLVFDDACRGVHGTAEREAFAALPEFPSQDSAHLCRLTLMQALPALAESDIEGFGQAITELQRRIGDYFAPVQEGRYASTRVGEAVEWLSRGGAAGPSGCRRTPS